MTVLVLRSRQTRVGIVLLVFTLLVTVLGPIFAPHAPSAIVGNPYQAPSAGALLGTDFLGHDVLSRVLDGGRSLLVMSVLATMLGVLIGTVVGLVAAYMDGATDGFLMRAMDMLLAFPTVVLALLLVSALGTSRPLLVVIVGVAHIPSVARVVRGAAMGVVASEYVQWAEAVGRPLRGILFREVLPNITSPLFVEVGLKLMWSVGGLASLSYLGYGIQPPAADWGVMVSENQNALQSQPYAVLAPVIALIIFTTGANLLAEGAARVIAHTSEAD